MQKLVHRFMIFALGTAILLTPAYSTTITSNLTPTDLGNLITGAQVIDYTVLDTKTTSGNQVATPASTGIVINGVTFLGINSNSTDATYLQWYPGTSKDWGPLSHAIVGTDQTGYFNPTLAVTLPVSVTALGINLAAVNSSGVAGGTLTLTLWNGATSIGTATVDTPSWTGSTSYPSPRSSGLSPAFLGLTSDTPFTRITVTSLNGAQILTDYLEFGQAQLPVAAPEPSTWALFGLGLTGIGLRQRRKR